MLIFSIILLSFAVAASEKHRKLDASSTNLESDASGTRRVKKSSPSLEQEDLVGGFDFHKGRTQCMPDGEFGCYMRGRGAEGGCCRENSVCIQGGSIYQWCIQPDDLGLSRPGHRCDHRGKNQKERDDMCAGYHVCSQKGKEGREFGCDDYYCCAYPDAKYWSTWVKPECKPQDDWVDKYGNDCAWYGAEKERCEILGDISTRRAANRNTAMEDCCECQEGDMGGPAFNAPGRYCTDVKEFEKVGAREKPWSRPDARDYMKADAWVVDLANAKPRPEGAAAPGAPVIPQMVCTPGYSANWQSESRNMGSDAAGGVLSETNGKTKESCSDHCEQQSDQSAFNFHKNGVCRCYTQSQGAQVWDNLVDDSNWSFCKKELEVQVAEEVCTDFARNAEAAKRLGSDGCLAQYDGWSEDEYCGQYKYELCTDPNWGEAYSACCPDWCGELVRNYVDCNWFEQDVGRCEGKYGQLQGTDCLTANDVCCVCRYGKVANHWGPYTKKDGSLVDKWSGLESQSETGVASQKARLKKAKESKSEILKETSLASQNARLKETNRALKDALNALTN